ncbi:MAG TPA: N-acetylmuramoyl-L-alanine amidase [Thermoanaerobaculia bacterium]|jgi:hypothetical protein|nr:N-acetylmuramoyl-L-alanine amidase [Thermoanaerobaculia bacterium]
MILDPAWLPNCSMRRVICHWTAGAYKASSLDKEHYHFLVEADGKVVRGRHSIADNVSTDDGIYAAHTLGANTGAIGIAVCAMFNAVQSPFHPGSFPMLESQWLRLADIAAEVCRAYSLPVTPQTVLGHGEVQVQLSIAQKGKWDPMVLPWQPSWSITQVGTYFRTLVQARLQAASEAVEAPVLASVVFEGKKIGDARLVNEGVYAPAGAVAAKLGLAAPAAGASSLLLANGNPVAIDTLDATDWVDVMAVATALGRKTRWNSGTRVLTVL